MAKKRSEMMPEELEQARELGRNWQAQRRKKIKEEQEKIKAAEKEELQREQPGADAEPEQVGQEPEQEKQTAPDKQKTELEGEFVYKGVPVFLCTECGGQVPGGVDICPKCGVHCDWRGVPFFENSEEYIVCDNCGAVIPAAEFRGKCKRCGYEGE